MREKRLVFVLAVALKWGGLLWLLNVLSKALYRYHFGKLSLDSDFLGYAAFSLLFSFAMGCILGLLMSRRASRDSDL
jgi:hypothetical protein